MTKYTSISEIMLELESGNYSYYGFRNATEHDLKVMERGYLDCSYDWIDGEQTEEELSGSCAVAIGDYLSENEIAERYNQCRKSYSGNTILLVADNRSEYGNDENEIILGSNGCGADVIAIVEL